MGRRWVTNFDHGVVWLEAPDKVTKEELPLIKDWLELIYKQFERTAVEEEEVRGS